ncbi:hypothetical protein [Streptomyces sp. NPDC088925]|uniref:hypothetical protein n=1 Tax=Streptomyces sp. NPDC088925 TaxID=3365914 RepID=UPI0037FF6F5D
MTPRRVRQALPALALAALALAGCSAGDGGTGDSRPPMPPAPSGTGPYPTPTSPTAAAPLPSHTVRAPQGGTPRPEDLSAAEQRDATTVSRAALTVLTTYDTRIDQSRYDAAVRTADAGWCTPEYAATLREGRPHAAPGADWTAWAAHGAVTRPRLVAADEDGRPADTPTTAYRQWTITLRPTGRAGWTADAPPMTAYAELHRASASAPWRLAGATLQ